MPNACGHSKLTSDRATRELTYGMSTNSPILPVATVAQFILRILLPFVSGSPEPAMCTVPNGGRHCAFGRFHLWPSIATYWGLRASSSVNRSTGGACWQIIWCSSGKGSLSPMPANLPTMSVPSPSLIGLSVWGLNACPVAKFSSGFMVSVHIVLHVVRCQVKTLGEK